MRKLSLIVATVLIAAVSAFAGVSVSSPGSGSTVGSPVHFVASASSSASSISAMKVYVDGNTAYTTYSGSIDTYLSMSSGTHYIVTNAWDNSGNLYQDKRTITVSGTSTTSTSTSTSTSGAGVHFLSPTNGATTGSPVHVTASATPSGSYPITAMKLYVDGNDGYLSNSASMDTYASMGTGSHNLVINAWDSSGKLYSSSVTINVGSGSTSTSTTTTSTSSGAGVHFSSPGNGASVSSPFTVNASVTPSGSAPIASMILYLDGNQVKLVYSNSLSTSVSAGSGSHRLVINSWDNNGQMYTASETVTVGGTSTSTSSSSSSSSVSSGNTIYNVQAMSGWQSCSACAGNPSGTAPEASYSMNQYVGSPSMDGKTSQYNIWGSIPYTDVLWYKSLTSTMGSSAAASAHHFIYDTWFYLSNPQNAQALEFDINQFVNGHSLIFGTQCNLLNGHQWDYWNNTQQTWVHSGIYCGTPSANSWHHMVLEVERLSGDQLHYVSVTLDGVKSYYNAYSWPTSTSWTGVTVNFQMDGDYAEHSYSTWLDKFNFIYW